MTLLGLDDKPISDIKQQMLYIFNGYKYTRPSQSNLFGKILKSYRADMLVNANNLDAQANAIKSSLTAIYIRYGFEADLTITVTYKEELTGFEVEVTGTKEGAVHKLSESLILEK